ncbi:class I SAM-dependent methyltransferase [Sphaerotilaceae bacterium SBD11-9]
MLQPDSRPPTRTDIIDAYQVMLGRPPESEAAIDSHLVHTKTLRDVTKSIAASREFADRVGISAAPSPFVHFNASVNVRGIVEAHIRRDRKAVPGHYVNFLGVAVPTKVMAYLHDKGGQLDPVPIPANYHADMAEWASALRAVDLAKDYFSMIELGCGWACWMTNTGVAAKALGLRVDLIGIEGDSKHLDYAHEALGVNGIKPSEYKLLRGIAAADSGYALFPRRKEDEERWGFAPIFGKTLAESEAAVASGEFDSLPMVSLSEAIGDRSKIDLLHMDIQGGEADLVQQTVPLLSERVAYIVIGTHSRALEGRLMDTLLGAGWALEIERPAIFNVIGGTPQTTVDGVQAWKNPKFHGR